MKTNRAKRLVAVCTSLAVIVPVLAAMAEPGDAPAPSRVATLFGSRLIYEMGETVLFGALGIALAVLGYKIFDYAVPWDLEKEIAHDHNMAAAVVVAAIILGISLIVGLVLIA